MNLLGNFIIILITFLCNFNLLNAQTLRLESTINSIGYYIENANSISNKVSYHVKFKETSNIIWRNGIDPSSFNYLGGNKLFAGSILQLKAGLSYTIEVNIIDSLPTITTKTFTGIISTRNEPNVNIPTLDTLWVSTIGSGNTYSQNLPGAFDTLFNLHFLKIKCGTTIVCKGGSYYLGGLSYNINFVPCNNVTNPIVITAAVNEIATFDGSDSSTAASLPNWSVYDATNNIYSAIFPPATSFSTLMLYDTTRLFPYATIYTQQFGSFNIFYKESLTNCASYFGSGFYRNANSYFIKLANGENPNGKKITVSKHNNFLTINKNGASYNPKFIIKNISIKNYGKSNVSFNVLGGLINDYNTNALIFYNIKNAIIDNCKFEFNTMPILFNGNVDSSIIQNCFNKDQTGQWMHGAFKNTSLTLTGDINWITDKGKYGRGLEKSFVYFEPAPNYITKNIIIRKNTIDGIVSGVAGRQSETAPFQDVDIYDNVIENCFDAIDIVGNAANFRVWNNNISKSPIVFSLIPFAENNITYSNTGPAYFFRNVVSKSPTRNNIANNSNSFNPLIYITYGGCEGLQNKVWSTGLKMNTGPNPTIVRTEVHFYHNTISVEDSLSYNFFIWKNTWKKIISKNNSWNAKFNIVNFEDVANVSTYPFYSLNDNYFSERNKLGVINGVHGNTNTCNTYNNLDSLNKYLRLTTGNNDTSILKIKGYNLNPNFVNAALGNFELNTTSPLIDKGEIINNLSDEINVNYFNAAPDVGALEKQITTSIINVGINYISTQLYPNPSHGWFTIKAPKKIKQIRIFQLDGKMVFTNTYTPTETSKMVNVTKLAKGLFLVHIMYFDNTKSFKKLIL